VWNIFVCFSKYSLFVDSLLPFVLEGVMLNFFVCSLIGAHFFYGSWAYTLFFQWPLSPFARIQEEKSLWTLEYLFLVDGWHVLCNSRCGS
jgi:hypothetical protein